jgi:hypothetical protein
MVELLATSPVPDTWPALALPLWGLSTVTVLSVLAVLVLLAEPAAARRAPASSIAHPNEPARRGTSTVRPAISARAQT